MSHFIAANTGFLLVHHSLSGHYYPTKWIHKGANEYKNAHSRKIYTSIPLKAHGKPFFHCGIVSNTEPSFLFYSLRHSAAIPSEIWSFTYLCQFGEFLGYWSPEIHSVLASLWCLCFSLLCRIAKSHIYTNTLRKCLSNLDWLETIKMEYKFILGSEICLLNSLTLSTLLFPV